MDNFVYIFIYKNLKMFIIYNINDIKYFLFFFHNLLNFHLFNLSTVIPSNFEYLVNIEEY